MIGHISASVLDLSVPMAGERCRRLRSCCWLNPREWIGRCSMLSSRGCLHPVSCSTTGWENGAGMASWGISCIKWAGGQNSKLGDGVKVEILCDSNAYCILILTAYRHHLNSGLNDCVHLLVLVLKHARNMRHLVSVLLGEEDLRAKRTHSALFRRHHNFLACRLTFGGFLISSFSACFSALTFFSAPPSCLPPRIFVRTWSPSSIGLLWLSFAFDNGIIATLLCSALYC